MFCQYTITNLKFTNVLNGGVQLLPCDEFRPILLRYQVSWLKHKSLFIISNSNCVFHNKTHLIY